MRVTWIEAGIVAARAIPVSVANITALHQQGIRAILTLTEQPLTALRALPPAFFARLDIALAHVPVPDQQPPTFPQAGVILRVMAGAVLTHRPLLVHGHAGSGRTGTALQLFYLAHGLSLAGARARVRARRSQCILRSPAQEAFLTAFAAALRRPAPISSADTHN